MGFRGGVCREEAEKELWLGRECGGRLGGGDCGFVFLGDLGGGVGNGRGKNGRKRIMTAGVDLKT